ncbi:MAG: cation:dicarboxylase symporter family transporter [Hyphomicrobiales bacterium]|nr:cation:dicarboxylase symporter family transporter [Hyphomicrobiales bacterium]MBV8661828.1 cation:dicarboxylase symporter family transporter [Hyphomicrobiales bacterium]
MIELARQGRKGRAAARRVEIDRFVVILERAVENAGASTFERRERLYGRARQTLAAHLAAILAASPGLEPSQPQQDLEDAIQLVEARIAARGRRANSGSGPDRNTTEGKRLTAQTKSAFAPGAAITRLLSNPWVLLVSLALGIYFGAAQRTIASLLYPVADLYVELLKMVLIPFMISAIVISLSRLFTSHTMNKRIWPILILFMVSTGGVAALGVGSAALLSPGANISDSSRQTLGQLINSSPYAVDLELALDDPNTHVSDHSGDTVIGRVIPENIFQALTVGDNLKILFFAIAFGVGLGSLHMSKGDGLLAPLTTVYEICTKIIGWVNLLLPLALCAMVAKQVATVGPAQILAMLRFTVGFGVAAIVVCALAVLAIAICSRKSIGVVLQAVRQPALVAIATRSSVACIPTSIDALVDGLGYDRAHVELMVPLGVTLFRYGPILYYAFSTVFVAQLYSTQTSFAVYVLMALGAMLTGLASAGTTGVLTISLLGVIFQPLGLPLEAALALLITIDPIIDIFRTVTIVLPNCAVAAFIYRDTTNAADEALLSPTSGAAE